MPIEVSLLAAAVVAALVIGVDEEPREAASAEAADMAVSRMQQFRVLCALVLRDSARRQATRFNI